MTEIWDNGFKPLWDFNSHPHEEDDCAQKLEKPLYEYFNSHPHEEDDLILV